MVGISTHSETPLMENTEVRDKQKDGHVCKINIYDVQNILKKLRWGILILSQLRHVGSTKLLKTLYFAFIQSHLFILCSTGLGGVYLSTLHSLDILQKKAVRIVAKVPPLEHTNPLYIELGILSLRKLYAYSCVNDAIKRNLTSMLPQTHSTRNSRYTYGLIPRSTRILQSYTVHLVKLINAMPEDCYRDKNSLSSLKDHLLNITNPHLESILTGVPAIT